MKVMSKAFHRDGKVFYLPDANHFDPEPMNIDWLKDLEIPDTAKTLWFELLDEPTDNSIPVEASSCGLCIDLSTDEDQSSLYHN